VVERDYRSSAALNSVCAAVDTAFAPPNTKARVTPDCAAVKYADAVDGNALGSVSSNGPPTRAKYAAAGSASANVTPLAKPTVVGVAKNCCATRVAVT